MERTYFDMPFEVKAADVQEDGTFKGYGSTFGGKPDAYGDIIDEGAYAKTLAAGGHTGLGVAMLYQHRYDEIPGVWTMLAEDKKGLYVEGALLMDTQLGKETHVRLKAKALRGLSIGYDAIDYERDDKRKVRHLKEIDLWEISLVTFPAQTRAHVTAVKMIEEARTERELEEALREAGLSKQEAQVIVRLARPSLRESEEDGKVEIIDAMNNLLNSLRDVNKDLSEVVESKGVIPFKSYPLADEGMSWDAGAEVKKAEVSDLKKMCTWFNSATADAKGSYKLPHHKVSGYSTVWRGVANAMARLMQAGTKIPAGDRKGCYNHLSKHYKEFDKEIPEYRADGYSEEELREVVPEAYDSGY